MHTLGTPSVASEQMVLYNLPKVSSQFSKYICFNNGHPRWLSDLFPAVHLCGARFEPQAGGVPAGWVFKSLLDCVGFPMLAFSHTSVFFTVFSK